MSITKRYWTIGEVAAELHVAPSLLHVWENEFLSFKKKFYHHKNRKGNRLFTIKNKEFIALICYYVKVELRTLAGARKKLLIGHGIECFSKTQVNR